MKAAVARAWWHRVPVARRRGAPRPATEAALYRFGLALGIRTLRHDARAAAKKLLLPVEYVRCAETRHVLRHLDVRPGHAVLDIGSPKLLALFLSARLEATVAATDLVDYFVAEYAFLSRRVLRLPPARFLPETQDARALAYADASFDRAYSISALEHIPGDGDMTALGEIARVLKPGGILCLTVPWNDGGYREVYKTPGDPDAYWTPDGPGPVFYQREYDATTLEQRLLGRRDLEPVSVSFWGERRVPIESWLLSRRIPRILRIGMYPAHYPLSRLFLRPLQAGDASRKKVACLTLRKAGDRS